MVFSIRKHLYSSLYGIILGTEAYFIAGTQSENNHIVLGSGLVATLGGCALMNFIQNIIPPTPVQTQLHIRTPEEMQALRAKYSPEKREFLRQKYNLKHY